MTVEVSSVDGGGNGVGLWRRESSRRLSVERASSSASVNRLTGAGVEPAPRGWEGSDVLSEGKVLKESVERF